MIEPTSALSTRRAVDDQRRRPPGNRTPRHHQALPRRRRERRHHARYFRQRDPCLARRERCGEVDPDRYPRWPAAAGCRHDFHERTPGQDRLAGPKPRARYRHRFSARAAGAEPYGAGKPDAGRFVVASAAPASGARTFPRTIRPSRRGDRPERTGRTARTWRTTAGRDHARALARRERAHSRRADLNADAARCPSSGRGHEAAARQRRCHHLHYPQDAGSLRARRSNSRCCAWAGSSAGSTRTNSQA